MARGHAAQDRGAADGPAPHGLRRRCSPTRLAYQQIAVRKALDPENLRPRILLADAVGLGKTLEIGMILAELVRRGRGERILIVTPAPRAGADAGRAVVRGSRCRSCGSTRSGIQRVRQKLPATRNPFTLLQARHHLDRHAEERALPGPPASTSSGTPSSSTSRTTSPTRRTQNNRLARVLAPNTDALILASATPHNGKPESFAELIRLLEPTAVRPDGTLIEDEVARLVIRRHRHSPEVASVVGGDWAEREEPQNCARARLRAENAVAGELDTPGCTQPREPRRTRAARGALPVDPGQGLPLLPGRAA